MGIAYEEDDYARGEAQADMDWHVGCTPAWEYDPDWPTYPDEFIRGYEDTWRDKG